MEKSKHTYAVISEQLSRFFASVVIVIGLLVLFGWFSKLMYLTRFSINEVPMAPSTAYLFIVLAVGIWLFLCPQKLSINRNAAIVSAVIVICLSSLLVLTNIFNYYGSLEHAFITIPETQLSMELGHMSFITAGLFIITGIALLFLQSNRKILKTFSIIITLIIFMFSFILLLAYAFGIPFFYFDSFIPPAALTALSFLLVSITLMAASDKNTFFVKTIWKTSTSIKLLSVFLPTIILITVVESLIIIRIFPIFNIHPAIGVSFVSLIFVVLVIVAISIISKSIGKTLDTALKKLSDSEEKINSIFNNMADVLWSLSYPELKPILISKSAKDIYGYTADQFLNDPKLWINTIYSDDKQSYEIVLSELEKTGKSTREYRIVCPNGDIKYIIDRSWLIYENDKPVRVDGITKDITARKLVEEELKQSEEQLRTITDNLPILISQIDKDLKYTFANQYFYDKSIFESNIIGKNVLDVIGKKAFNSAYPQMQKVLSGELVSFENRTIHTKNNELIIFENNFIPHIVNGQVESFFILAMDITERKLAEEALRESEERFRGLLMNMGAGIVVHSADTSIVYNNNQASKILGLSDKQMKGKTVIDSAWKFVKSDKTPLPLADYPVNRVANNKIPIKNQVLGVSYPAKNGITWLTVNGFPIINYKGDIIEIVISFIDITERKLAEEALRESEGKLNALFTSLTEMVVMHELVYNDAGEAVNYRIIDCNKVFTEFTGISKEDALGKLATEVYKTDVPPYLKEYSKVALSGDFYEFNAYFPDLDKHLMISVVSPQIGKFATITTDITPMMQIQETIIAKNKEMENYLYVASHDLRTPLVNIQGFSQRLKIQADSINELLIDKNLEPEIRHQLNNITDENIPKTLNFIFSNIEKMDTLIKGLLKLSRTGRMDMNIEKIDMNELFANILHNLDFQIREANCKIHINSLPKCYGDVALLDQLFTNIISNALKYYDADRPLEITVDAKIFLDKVIFSISDTGKGIAKKYLNKIWDIFYRIDPRSGKAGEGIGLSLVKQIVEKHKGKIWVESEENIGSTFHVELHNRKFTEI